MRRRSAISTIRIPDPTTTPAIRSDHQEWMAEQERRRIAAEAAITKAAIERPIYPRELAEKIAADYVKQAYPDWRLMRFESRAMWGRLLRDQHEMQHPEVKQRGDVVSLLRNSLPGHLRPILTDLERILDMMATAREAAAFMVGFSLGKKAAAVHADQHGLLRTHRRPAREEDGLRLHDGASDSAPPWPEEPPRPAEPTAPPVAAPVTAPAPSTPSLVNLPADGAPLTSIIRAAFVVALERCHHRQTAAAALLHISPRRMNHHLKTFRLRPIDSRTLATGTATTEPQTGA